MLLTMTHTFQAAYPSFVPILKLKQQVMQQLHSHLTSNNKCAMLPQQNFGNSNHGLVRNHWTAFER